MLSYMLSIIFWSDLTRSLQITNKVRLEEGIHRDGDYWEYLGNGGRDFE